RKLAVGPCGRRIRAARPRRFILYRWIHGWIGSGSGAGNLMSQLGARGGPYHAHFRSYAQLAHEFVTHAAHVEIDAAAWLGYKINGSQFECLKSDLRTFARFRADDNDWPRIGGHDLLGCLQAVKMGHVD